jgi:2-amino-4-hydroxy-6-hydroxymethyldihydropteridine diphosphokinase
MPRAGIALGSNLGDRMSNLRAALHALRQIASPGEPFLTAPVYQTEPRLCPPGSPDFLNTVVEIGFDGSPLELLALTRAIEKQLGRTRGAERNTPRTIDIDLLYLGDEVLGEDELTLPHPRIGERRFVLQPLADIRPELVLPGQSQTVARMLEWLGTGESSLIPVSGDSW